MQKQKATRWWGKRQIIMDFQYVVCNIICNIYKTKNLSLNHVDNTTYTMEGKSAVRERMFKRCSYSYPGNGCILVNQMNLAGYPTHPSVHFSNPGRHFCSFLSIIYFYHQRVNIPIAVNKIGRCTIWMFSIPRHPSEGWNLMILQMNLNRALPSSTSLVHKCRSTRNE